MTITQHFLITRFNLRLGNVKADRDLRPVLTEEWMAERLDLIEQVCVPSVQHQTNQDFVWLLLLDGGGDGFLADISDPFNIRWRSAQAVSSDE